MVVPECLAIPSGARAPSACILLAEPPNFTVARRLAPPAFDSSLSAATFGGRDRPDTQRRPKPIHGDLEPNRPNGGGPAQAVRVGHIQAAFHQLKVVPSRPWAPPVPRSNRNKLLHFAKVVKKWRVELFFVKQFADFYDLEKYRI